MVTVPIRFQGRTASGEAMGRMDEIVDRLTPAHQSASIKIENPGSRGLSTQGISNRVTGSPC